MGECMDCPVEYAEQQFDCDPTTARRVTPDERIQFGRSCNLCRAPLGPESDYGYWDFSNIEDDGEDPDWVPLCFGCYRPIAYGESDVTDPKTGKRATDGLEAV